ncbi:SDR family NAD(P)-dependent oxidoreductase [Mycolicibacterium sp. 3033]|nr:SDR family NAD(P)-dependent oxidoreductase [Mycolicibacterium aurantiacum]
MTTGGSLAWGLSAELDPMRHLRRIRHALTGGSADSDLVDAVAGRRVLITGASTGIGAEVAVAAARAGAQVLLVARRSDLLDDVVAHIAERGGSARSYPCDLSDPTHTAELAQRVIDECGGVDVLVNNAGRSIRRALSETTQRLHDFQRVMAVNFFGMVNLTVPLVEVMRRTGGGHVVNVSTMGTEFAAQPLFSAYLASKGAMDSFARSVAAETRIDDVKWTTVHMPLVRTEMIAPTDAYRGVPAMSAAQGADMVLDAIRYAPARVSHPLGVLGSVADRFVPRALDAIRARDFSPTPQVPLPSVAVVGAGVSGIAMALALQDAGASHFTVFDKADDIGGTWRENSYPGLACDVPSHYYSFRDHPNPQWSRLFSPGAEIQAYLQKVVRTRDLASHLRLGIEIVAATFSHDHWELRSSDGAVHRADVMVCATGVLHRINEPAIPGLADFAGPRFHSARWDHDVEVDGARVGVIGSGSTGVQITSALAGRARSLTLFQRTPHWVATVPNPPIPAAVRALLGHVPGATRAVYESNRVAFDLFAKAVTGNGWQRRAMALLARSSLAGVSDNALRAALTPDDQPGCKRLVFSPDFYDAVQRDDVEVVTSAIDRIESAGVRTADGVLHELDVLVTATGFDAQSYMRPMELTGPDGSTIDDLWSRGPYAYRTAAVPGLPNLFLILGPYSPLGNSSLVPVAEVQARYVVNWLQRMRERNLASVDVTRDATDQFRRDVAAAAPNTLWSTGCQSWYLGPDGTPLLWPWPMDRFRADLAEPDPDHFHERPRADTRGVEPRSAP